MIRFMICDTDAQFLDQLAGELHRNFSPCTVQYLYGPSALEVALRSDSNGADVLLTEIELRGHNAISILARHLKENSLLQVIYMTAKIEYCTEVYDTPHCGFLLKPVGLDQLLKNVRRALSALESRKTSGILAQRGGQRYILAPQSILYLESRGRILRIVTDDGALETYDKITHFALQLDGRFLRCHKSYMVNMERVKEYHGSNFLMCNEISLPVSQSRRKEVRQRFLSYMGSAAT